MMDNRMSYRRRAAYLPWSHNPLMRRGDRMVAAAVVTSVVVLILAIALSVWAAGATYRSVTDSADAATPISATVLNVSDPDPTAVETSATVSWRDSSGVHTDSMSVPRGTKDGSTTHAWTTPDGTRLQDHPGPAERVLAAIWVGVLAWCVAFALVMSGVTLVRRRVARIHAVLWDREWSHACNTNGWASR
ncbi:hypothetical protein EF294_13285 [Gordonia oryzae]|uniref:Uncharacterized protein n=2 Tax=Gordonia oryzae TaxID=2487349 RepID=A0A3N4G9U8_9ACTN|nr:hypothetical protein EF294_13285 [Gordonia oryzae]